MIADNGTWPVRVPSNLKAGEYVIRHELIALHVANNAIGQGDYPADGAEFYPQCVTIKVPGTGTKVITGGVDARTLYKGSEPGLAINIHTTNMHWDYQFPGPAVWSGA
ncbi:glycoside hydrolase [Massariosphaeria phaeospora]|uniref:Glycoside hydrolase n=1 Tax=Massariosphaeria phaeospora TaxID=100035 RepID=A0A7C8I1T4_9PLEO|nr:glycoside hydrolase [Massariosphaeria phaeospora]